MYPLIFILFLIICGLVIDVGLIYNAQTDLKRATDAAALAGALQLNHVEEIEPTVNHYLELNKVQNTTASNPIITLGSWDDVSQSFDTTMNTPATAIQVSASFIGTYYFSRIFGLETYTLTANSIASVVDNRPLNIMLVADISANMSWASQLQGVGIDDVTQSRVLNNIQQIYNELSSLGIFNNSNYGVLTWDETLSNESVTAVLNKLKLKNVAYPYSGFTWEDYVTYALNLTKANNAYKKHYGFLTLINFWQEKAYAASQTPILKQVSEQPLRTVKNAVSYLTTILNPDSDRLGLTVISSGANLITPTSNTYNEVLDPLQSYQAGEFGSPDGTLLPAINQAMDSLLNSPKKNYKKVILILANGATVWDENNNDIAEINDTIHQLRQNEIYVYRMVIGPDTNPQFSSLITTKTNGALYFVTLGSTDYTSEIDAFYSDLRKGPPRLVQ